MINSFIFFSIAKFIERRDLLNYISLSKKFYEWYKKNDCFVTIEHLRPDERTLALCIKKQDRDSLRFIGNYFKFHHPKIARYLFSKSLKHGNIEILELLFSVFEPAIPSIYFPGFFESVCKKEGIETVRYLYDCRERFKNGIDQDWHGGVYANCALSNPDRRVFDFCLGLVSQDQLQNLFLSAAKGGKILFMQQILSRIENPSRIMFQRAFVDVAYASHWSMNSDLKLECLEYIVGLHRRNPEMVGLNEPEVMNGAFAKAILRSHSTVVRYILNLKEEGFPLNPRILHDAPLFKALSTRNEATINCLLDAVKKYKDIEKEDHRIILVSNRSIVHSATRRWLGWYGCLQYIATKDKIFSCANIVRRMKNEYHYELDSYEYKKCMKWLEKYEVVEEKERKEKRFENVVINILIAFGIFVFLSMFVMIALIPFYGK